LLPGDIERYGVAVDILIFFLFAYYDKKKKGKKLNKGPIGEKGNLSNCQSLVSERLPLSPEVDPGADLMEKSDSAFVKISSVGRSNRCMQQVGGMGPKIPSENKAASPQGWWVMRGFGNGRFSGRPRRGRLVWVNLTVCEWGVRVSFTAHAVSP
jgi:hypothetical protein